jgi:hypothetical protein
MLAHLGECKGDAGWHDLKTAPGALPKFGIARMRSSFYGVSAVGG